MMGWERHTDGGFDWLDRAGTGPVIVLLHGIGSEGDSFTPVLPHLPLDWRVIAWNAPGYRGSDPLPQSWPMAADYAAALALLLNRLEVPRVVLAGHSLGALMAASFARLKPRAVSRLLLAAPALGQGVDPGGTLPAKAQSRIDDLKRLGSEQFANNRAARLVHAPAENREIVEAVRTSMAKVRMRGYEQAVRMLASGRLLDELALINVPTDILQGAEDVVTPPDGARQAHDALPTAMRGRLTMVPESGHALHQQAPADFAKALIDTTGDAT